MEITDVSAYPVRVPLRSRNEGGIAPYVTNHNSIEAMERVLVRVDTDEGVHGWGEVRTYLSPSATVSVIEEGVAPLVTGWSPFELERIQRAVFMEYANPSLFFAPVETACWDIVGKTLDRPVYELLGGWTAPSTEGRRRDAAAADRSAVPAAYCLGILSPEESAEHAQYAREQGYSVLKTKAGRDWRQDVERIIAMHEAVDGELEFRLDPNQGWRLDEAVRVAATLEDAGIYLQYMEQPIRVDDHGSLSHLRKRTRQPIAGNEDTYIPNNPMKLVRNDAVDVAVVDFTPLGGISGLRKAAATLEAGNIPLAHHCAMDLGVRTAAIVHAVRGIPGFDLPMDTTYYAWEDDVIETPLDIEDGSIETPDGAGLGVEVDPDTVAEYAIE